MLIVHSALVARSITTAPAGRPRTGARFPMPMARPLDGRTGWVLLGAPTGLPPDCPSGPSAKSFLE
jgi:hypothetical protein